ncbi:peptidyl-tRNA hydrolase domain protein [Cellvibrio sp. BR]|jgi:ribosome-associated protein|uniref:alternative ribosome rescue aminoacyl-tRNA hydrolase ArfB n=1 Tax=unclassified Cellvibrio TaxID=2624793 RepID=UPI0002601850|nr:MULTISPECIES: alternative ribosome rescue aminoacyl-tRNA hydrolase ArfB [unclassified Cellvibrio]EIK45453.1 peptidyl-tRNA hydrolase domain protein [Cellvibrio sp. BR]QEY13486.1 aminoacyl-tRNA hydrolase [Cellvibrio sp. KY-YJ-3]UUA73163.1 aminoacyl-tRNA hydrolase [Cellvibrio sp. QJXJ]
MLRINASIVIPPSEIELTAMRAQGAGGQNVNKVSSAIHLRFDIPNSSLSDFCKSRLLALGDKRITNDGVLIIKAQTYRTQEQNRDDALVRLREIILGAIKIEKPRHATRPTFSSKQRRMDEKTQRGSIKSARQKKISFD